MHDAIQEAYADIGHFITLHGAIEVGLQRAPQNIGMVTHLNEQKRLLNTGGEMPRWPTYDPPATELTRKISGARRSLNKAVDDESRSLMGAFGRWKARFDRSKDIRDLLCHGQTHVIPGRGPQKTMIVTYNPVTEAAAHAEAMATRDQISTHLGALSPENRRAEIARLRGAPSLVAEAMTKRHHKMSIDDLKAHVTDAQSILAELQDIVSPINFYEVPSV